MCAQIASFLIYNKNSLQGVLEKSLSIYYGYQGRSEKVNNE
jgi:hypothetical protein